MVLWNRHHGSLTDVLTRHIGRGIVNQRSIHGNHAHLEEFPRVRDNSDTGGMRAVEGGG